MYCLNLSNFERKKEKTDCKGMHAHFGKRNLTEGKYFVIYAFLKLT